MNALSEKCLQIKLFRFALETKKVKYLKNNKERKNSNQTENKTHPQTHTKDAPQKGRTGNNRKYLMKNTKGWDLC